MRTLYVKIFLAFWLAMLLIGASLLVLTMTTESWRAEQQSRERYLRQLARDLVWVYESRGEEGLDATVARLEQSQKIRVFLFRGPIPLQTVTPVPASISHMASEAVYTGEIQRRFGPGSRWLGLPTSSGYVLVYGQRAPSQLQRLLSPRRIGLRALVTLVFGGLICFLLARSLTAPIRTLRAATHRFSEGDFKARVGGELGRRRDEIADLGRDFDQMAERIEGLMNGQRRLLRDVSHELRSPLARLTVALELARASCPPEAAGPLDRIELEANRLNGLIGQLLTLAALESGADASEKGPVDLKVLVEEVADDADFEAQHHRRTVRVARAEPLTTHGSETLLRQAVENIVRNALRYTAEETAVEITLERSPTQQGPGALLTVRDHGPGVPEEALPHLFEPFYRVAEARERQSGGTGIGLAIAERAVVAHGGAISATNAPEGGLLVRIRLPLTVSGESA